MVVSCIEISILGYFLLSQDIEYEITCRHLLPLLWTTSVNAQKGCATVNSTTS